MSFPTTADFKEIPDITPEQVANVTALIRSRVPAPHQKEALQMLGLIDDDPHTCAAGIHVRTPENTGKASRGNIYCKTCGHDNRVAIADINQKKRFNE